MSRVRAKELLGKHKVEGVFITRNSNGTTGDFILSVESVVKNPGGMDHGLGERVNHGPSNDVCIFIKIVYPSRQCLPLKLKRISELNYKRGKVIQVLGRSDANWWKGMCNGQIGIFPYNYVKQLNYEK